jgi:hypothetical protein
MKSLTKYKVLTIFLGLLTAGAVVTSQTFYFQASSIKKEKTEQNDKSDDSDESSSYISVPDSSIPSSFSVQLNQELSFVLEILFKTDHDSDLIHSPAISTGQLFHTLFSALISPNAP